MALTYSICMCNYNMADTLEQSLRSLLEPRDERFELVLVDDGSTDGSVSIVQGLQTEFPALRLVELKRDNKRRLGETRNISIREAKGEYVLLHLDCDDVWEPYLGDFVAAFHQIEKAVGHDIYLCGQHVNMGRREFLLDHGPYDNIYRGEDRYLWAKMAAVDAYIPFEHEAFFRRLPKTMDKRTTRTIYHLWDHFVTDFRARHSLWFCFVQEFKQSEFSLLSRIARFGMLLPAWIYAQFRPKIDIPASMRVPQNFQDYREANRGDFKKILSRYDVKPDYSVFTSRGKEIFE